MPAPDALIRRLSLAFEFAVTDEDALTESIYQQRATAWRAALTEEARSSGSGKQGVGPNGDNRDYLRQMSRQDAQSVRQTFNRDLASQINQLYDAQPDGRRDYYVQALTRWANERAQWKDRQIATMNRGSARTYAQQQFNMRNNVGHALYLYGGPSPRGPRCADHFAAGVVNQQYVDANPQPEHVNCPHYWQKQQSRVGVPLDKLWVG